MCTVPSVRTWYLANNQNRKKKKNTKKGNRTHGTPVPLVRAGRVVEVSPAADPLPVALRAVAVVRHGLEGLCGVAAQVARLSSLLAPVLFRFHALQRLLRLRFSVV